MQYHEKLRILNKMYFNKIVEYNSINSKPLFLLYNYLFKLFCVSYWAFRGDISYINLFFRLFLYFILSVYPGVFNVIFVLV